jgi:hypothetical protein
MLSVSQLPQKRFSLLDNRNLKELEDRIILKLLTLFQLFILFFYPFFLLHPPLSFKLNLYL